MLLERSGFPVAEQWTERSWRGELLGEGRTILIARAQHPVGVISIKTVGEHTVGLKLTSGVVAHINVNVVAA